MNASTSRMRNIFFLFPVSVGIKWLKVDCWSSTVENLVTDIRSAIGRMPDHEWPTGDGLRYTLG
jgi:hypothetical protein